MDSHHLSQAVRDHQLTARIGKSDRYIIHDIRDARLPPSAPPYPQTWRSSKKPIGDGGQGRVYLQKCIGGAQTHDITQRAVKVIPYQNHDEKRRYRRELETLVRFSHQRYAHHFVRMFSWYELGSDICIAMEYFPAGDLQSYLKDHPPLSEAEGREVTGQVLLGLSIMHAHDVVHCDIKPQNILIQDCPTLADPSKNWYVKIADFGISKRTDISGTTSNVGTLDYMAPELLGYRSEGGHLDLKAADIWSVGAMACYSITKSRSYLTRRLPAAPQGPIDDFLPAHHGISDDGVAFLSSSMEWDPRKRLGWATALSHVWVKQVVGSSVPPIPPEETESSTESPSSAHSSFIDTPERSTLATVQIETITQHDEHHLVPPKAQTKAVPPPPRESTPPSASTQIAIRAATAVPTAAKGGAPRPLVDHSGDISMPLAAAAFRGDLEAVKLLAPSGMSFHAWFDRGFAALHWAAEGGNVDVVTFLLDMGAPVNHGTQFERETAIHIAARRGHADVVRVLLDRGADPRMESNKGETLGLFAILSGSLDTLKVLAEYANKRVDDAITGVKKEHSAVSLAIALSRPEAAMWLLEHGADASGSGDGGKAPIHYAAESGYPDLVKFLVLKKQVSVNAPTKDKWTPLHFAAKTRQADVIRLLLEQDAVIDPYPHPTATSVARIPGYADIVRLLLDEFAYRRLVNGRFARPCPFEGSLHTTDWVIPRKLTSSMSRSTDEIVCYLGDEDTKKRYRLQIIRGFRGNAPPCWALFAGSTELHEKWATSSEVIHGDDSFDDLNRYIYLAPTLGEPNDVRVLRADFHAASETVRYYFPSSSKKPEDRSLHPTDDLVWSPEGPNNRSEEKPPFVYSLQRSERRQESAVRGENATTPRMSEGQIAILTVDKKILKRGWSFELRFLTDTLDHKTESLIVMTAWEVFLRLVKGTGAWTLMRAALGYDYQETGHKDGIEQGVEPRIISLARSAAIHHS